MEEDNTLELIDYLRVIWKWKLFITAITVIFLFIAVTLNFLMANVYDVSMVVEPAVSNFDSSWRPIYIDSNTDIKSKVDLGMYDNTIFDLMHFDSPKKKLFKTFIPKDSNILKISIEIIDVKKGAQVLKLLNDLLLEEYKRSIKERKLQIENVLRMKVAQSQNIVDEGNQLKKEIKTAGLNTEKLIRERDVLISGGEKSADKLSILIYTNTIQGNIAYKNRLQKQLNKAISEKERMKAEIENLKVKMGSIRNIRLLNPPEPSVGAIKPRKLLNIILAFAIGLIVSFFLAFFLEYIQKMRINT